MREGDRWKCYGKMAGKARKIFYGVIDVLLWISVGSSRVRRNRSARMQRVEKPGCDRAEVRRKPECGGTGVRRRP